jgi:hypothetical protein
MKRMKREVFFRALSAGALLFAACSEKKTPPGASPGATPGKASFAEPSRPGQPRAAAVAAATETEPNDTFAKANALALGQPMEGRMSSPRDVDHFRVVSPHPRGILRAELSGVPGLDLALSLFQVSPKRELARADNGGAGEGELLPNVGVGAGEYILAVRQAGKSRGQSDTPYRLTVAIEPAADGDEREPNDQRADAQEIEPGKPVRGLFGKKFDVDWYKLVLPALTKDNILKVEVSGVRSTPWMKLAVLDEIEAPLKDTTVTKGAPAQLSNLHVKAGQKALYILVRAGKAFDPQERYTLQATLSEAGDSPTEHEPNDRPAQATPIQPGTAVKGTISPRGDEDWYAVEVPSASLGRIRVTGVDGVDLVLSVHDESGKERIKVDENKVREGEEIVTVPLAPGKSLVRVAAAKKYQENPTQSYELTVELRPDDELEEREPNDLGSNATEVKLGGKRRGYIHPKGDIDVYRLDLSAETASRKVRVDLQGIPKVALRLAVLDATGKRVAETAAKAPEESIFVEPDLAPGMYFIEVQGVKKLSNPRDRYELSVK